MILSNDCYLSEKCKKFLRKDCSLDGTFCQKLFRVDKLLSAALLTDVQRKPIKLFLDKIDEVAYNSLKSVETSIESAVESGCNIYIYSNITGNGKTSWAIKLIQAYVNAVWYKKSTECVALFINIPRFLLALKDNISEKSEYIEHIKKYILVADIVVWDDIGTKGTTEFETEHLLSMINSRIESGKANIFTSNVSPQDLPYVVGQRLASRVAKKSWCIGFRSGDKREM